MTFKRHVVGWRKLRVLQLGDKFAILPLGIYFYGRSHLLKAVLTESDKGKQTYFKGTVLLSMVPYPSAMRRLFEFLPETLSVSGYMSHIKMPAEFFTRTYSSLEEIEQLTFPDDPVLTPEFQFFKDLLNTEGAFKPDRTVDYRIQLGLPVNGKALTKLLKVYKGDPFIFYSNLVEMGQYPESHWSKAQVNSKKLHKAFKAFRLITNHTLKEAGVLAGYSSSYYHDMESGKTYPNDESFYRWINGLSKSTTDPEIIAHYKSNLIKIYESLKL